MSQLTTTIRDGGLSTATARTRAIGSGLAALAVAVAIAIYGAYGDPHPKASQEHVVPFICAVVAVVSIGIFGFLVPAGLRGMATRRGRWSGVALALGVIGIVLIPIAFWSGLPVVVGTAAAVLGVGGRQSAMSGGRAQATWAVVLGALAAAGGVVITILGNTLAS